MTWGLALHEDDFVTTIGATEALHLCLRAVAKPGDTVAVESPCYFGILQAIEDGRVLNGPSTHSQPCLIVRERDGRIEVKSAG